MKCKVTERNLIDHLDMKYLLIQHSYNKWIDDHNYMKLIK
jgi:hypothetical protein